GGRAAFVLEAAETQAGMQAERDLGLHVDELLLDELVGGERPAELLAVDRVVARRMPAELRGAERTPGDPVPRVVEAGERSLEAADLGKDVLLRHEDVIHHDLAGHRGAQRKLALDL